MITSRRAILRASASLSAAALLARFPGARLVRAQGGAAEYDLIDLGTFVDAVINEFGNELRGGVSVVNDSGMVAGSVVASAEKFSPATWSPTGKLTRIKSGTYGGAVYGVNATGVLVGAEYRKPGALTRPVLWRDGEKEALPYPAEFTDDFQGYANAINDDDVVVGGAYYNFDNTIPNSPPSVLITALRWTGDEVEILSRPEGVGASSQAFAINAAGAIAGTVRDGERDQIAVWDGDGLDLYGLPPQLVQVSYFTPTGINAAGLIVASGSADGAYHAFLYDRGEPTRLPTLTEEFAPFANAVNDDGTVVGTFIATEEGAPSFAAIWVDGEPRDLNDLVPSAAGLRLSGAIDVSNTGMIVANAVDDEEVRHGVLLVPGS